MRAAILVVAVLAGTAAADDPKPAPPAPKPAPAPPAPKTDETTVDVVKPPPPPPVVHPEKEAPPPPPDPFADFTGANAGARALFDEARKLANEGKHADACAKLTASWAQEEATSTEMGLGACREREGKPAQARRLYLDAAKRSRSSGFELRAQAATARATALEPGLPTVTIRLTQPIEPGTVVMIDDQVVETTPEIREFVDAGYVTITAKAPNGASSTRRFNVFPKTSTNVEVAPLVVRSGGRNPVWIGASVVLAAGGLIALGAGSGAVQFVGGAAVAAGIGVFLLAPREDVTVVPMTTSSGDAAGVAIVGRF